MSRSTVVRRLTAAVALLAVLGLAVPTAAAPLASHAAKPPGVAQASLLDQLMSWLAALGFGPAPAARPRAGSIDKSTSFTGPIDGITSQTVNSTDVSIGVDPNGHS